MKSANKLSINFDLEEVILSVSDTFVAIRALQTSINPNLKSQSRVLEKCPKIIDFVEPKKNMLISPSGRG